MGNGIDLHILAGIRNASIECQPCGGDGGDDTRMGLLQVAPGEREIEYMNNMFEGVVSHTEEIDAKIFASSNKNTIIPIINKNLSKFLTFFNIFLLLIFVTNTDYTSLVTKCFTFLDGFLSSVRKNSG